MPQWRVLRSGQTWTPTDCHLSRTGIDHVTEIEGKWDAHPGPFSRPSEGRRFGPAASWGPARGFLQPHFSHQVLGEAFVKFGGRHARPRSLLTGGRALGPEDRRRLLQVRPFFIGPEKLKG